MLLDSKAPNFCHAQTECVERGNDWREVGLSDDRLRLTINRITRLKAARLTIEHVGADFLLRRISPLQKRDRFT